MGSRKACASRMSEAVVRMEPVMVRVAMRWTFSRSCVLESQSTVKLISEPPTTAVKLSGSMRELSKKAKARDQDSLYIVFA